MHKNIQDWLKRNRGALLKVVMMMMERVMILIMVHNNVHVCLSQSGDKDWMLLSGSIHR